MGLTNDLQIAILRFISEWAKEHKQPVPQHTIIERLSGDTPDTTVKAAVRVLVRKGYLRKSSSLTNAASYVQLRTV